MILLWLYLILYPFSMLICVGWLLAHHQNNKYPSLAEKDYREDLGVAIDLGCVLSFLPGLGIGMAYLMSGFAQYGWQILPRKRQ